MGKKETAYCWFLLALLISYNAYFYFNTNAEFILWILAFIFTCLISTVVIVVRLSRWIYRRQAFRPIGRHLLYVLFCTASLAYHSEMDYARRYVEARVFFARETAPCQQDAKHSHHVTVCYVFYHEPRIDVILVDPQRELLKPREQWQVSTQAYLDAQKDKGVHLIGDCQTEMNHFFDDVFYARLRCE